MESKPALSRRQMLKLLGLGAAQAAVLAACGGTAPSQPAASGNQPSGGAQGGSGKLEIFSWWTSGGEVEALNALYDIYKKKYPGVEVVNAALAGGAGAGGNMKAVLKTRMLGGDPPDSFQVHLGHELIDSHVVPGRMEPLDELFASEGWNDVFPKQLTEIASYQGKPYSVPVNIHRSNVLWYHKGLFGQAGVEKPPADWNEFFAAADKLKAKNIPALAIAEKDPGFTGHVFENILLATLGPDGYRSLFNGKLKWDDAKVTDALNTLKKALDYANPSYTSVSWGDVNDLIVAGKVAMMIMGDWTHGLLKSKKFSDYGWAPAPGTSGVFMALSDSFGLPKGAKDRDNVLNWLKICGSKEGQDAFNPLKGSIPGRTDADLSKYDEYQKGAINDFKSNQITPSIVHGAAAKESFMTDFANVLNIMATKKNPDEVQTKLVQAATDANFGA
jgi:glucose/mannose transport system substrate-binding protein